MVAACWNRGKINHHRYLPSSYSVLAEILQSLGSLRMTPGLPRLAPMWAPNVLLQVFIGRL